MKMVLTLLQQREPTQIQLLVKYRKGHGLLKMQNKRFWNSDYIEDYGHKYPQERPWQLLV